MCHCFIGGTQTSARQSSPSNLTSVLHAERMFNYHGLLGRGRGSPLAVVGGDASLASVLQPPFVWMDSTHVFPCSFLPSMSTTKHAIHPHSCVCMSCSFSHGMHVVVPTTPWHGMSLLVVVGNEPSLVHPTNHIGRWVREGNDTGNNTRKDKRKTHRDDGG